MKTAIVTGASSGIGTAICEMLLSESYLVFGFGRDFSNCPLEHSNFHAIVCDITRIADLTTHIQSIQKEHDISLLINNAGVGFFAPHEELNPKKIHDMITTNLEVPMVLSQMLLRNFKKNRGCIINISSITAKKPNNTYGCAYGATKAALSSFSQSLYEETRKYGVKVITIHPDMTQSNFYRNANFGPGASEDSYLLPEEIAECIRFLLSQRSGITMTDITLQPQKHQLTKS